MFESLLQTIAPGLNLSQDQAAFIRALWTPCRFQKGEFFQYPGAVVERGGFVADGCLRTYTIDAGGSESIVHFSPERTFVGDITSATTGTPTLCAVDAIEASTVLVIDLPSFNKLLDAFPDIARAYRLGLERTQSAQRRRIAMALSASAQERYADFVARHPALAARVPQRMLASYLGITPETLSRLRRTAAGSGGR